MGPRFRGDDGKFSWGGRTKRGFPLWCLHSQSMNRAGYVYILASQKNGTLYIGVTSRPIARIAEHRARRFDGFTRRYRAIRLVYYERHERVVDAIAREKAMKKWNRAWKVELIESVNPDWTDLWAHLNQEARWSRPPLPPPCAHAPAGSASSAGRRRSR